MDGIRAEKQHSLDENIDGIKVQVGLQREMRKRQQREYKKVEPSEGGRAGDVLHIHRVEFRATARRVHRRQRTTSSSRQAHNAHGPRRR